MKPLSQTRRRVYFWILTIFFILAIPFIVSSAQGYRLVKQEVVQTGGIYLSVGESGAQISLNGLPIETTSFLDKNRLIADLESGEYIVSIAKPNHFTWEKTIMIAPGRVSELAPLLVSSTSTVTEIRASIVATTTATSTGTAKVNTLYTEAIALFGEKAVLPATSTPLLIGGLALFHDTGSISMVWKGDSGDAPIYLCGNGDCLATSTLAVFTAPVKSIVVPQSKSGAVLIAVGSTVQIMELDTRGGHNVYTVFEGKIPNIREDDQGRLLIKDGERYFELSL